MNADFKEFARIVAANNVVFFFSGYFTQGVIATSTETIRSRLASNQASSATKRRLLSTFVELSQNVIHYSADAVTDDDANDDEMRFGTMCITSIGDHFGITCTNPVKVDGAERLEKELSMLRDMSMDEIKEAYRRMLRQEGIEEGRKGAGLGFLTMARDAAQPIDFSVETDPSWGDDFRVFYLKVTI